MIGRGVTVLEHVVFGSIGFALFCADEVNRLRRKRAADAARKDVLRLVREADLLVASAVLVECRGRGCPLARELREIARADGRLSELERGR